MKQLSGAWRVSLSVLLVGAGLLAVAAVAFVVARSATSTSTFSCEATLRLTSATTVEPALSAPWRPSIARAALDRQGETLALTGVGAFDGPPERGAAPVTPSTNAANTVVQWGFPGSSPQGKWLSCDYGGGVLRAVREADPETTTCEAQLARGDARRLSGARFHCR